MTKTSNEVADEALRRLNLVAVDDDGPGEYVARAKKALTSLLDELAAPPYSLALGWTAETVPVGTFRPLAWLVAVDIAPEYPVQAEPRSRALARLMANLRPDDRPDPADYDGDGEVSDAEADAYKRAAYY